MRWLMGVEQTDGQTGLVARLVLGPLSVQSVCMRLCLPGEQGEGECRWRNALRKLRGRRRVWPPSVNGQGVALSRWEM